MVHGIKDQNFYLIQDGRSNYDIGRLEHSKISHIVLKVPRSPIK